MAKNTVECLACGFKNAIVKPSGKGGLSTHCPECGYQGFARTPKAAAALGRKLTDAQPGDVVIADEKKGKVDDWLAKL